MRAFVQVRPSRRGGLGRCWPGLRLLACHSGVFAPAGHTPRPTVAVRLTVTQVGTGTVMAMNFSRTSRRHPGQSG